MYIHASSINKIFEVLQKAGTEIYSVQFKNYEQNQIFHNCVFHLFFNNPWKSCLLGASSDAILGASRNGKWFLLNYFVFWGCNAWCICDNDCYDHEYVLVCTVQEWLSQLGRDAHSREQAMLVHSQETYHSHVIAHIAMGHTVLHMHFDLSDG